MSLPSKTQTKQIPLKNITTFPKCLIQKKLLPYSVNCILIKKAHSHFFYFKNFSPLTAYSHITLLLSFKIYIFLSLFHRLISLRHLLQTNKKKNRKCFHPSILQTQQKNRDYRGISSFPAMIKEEKNENDFIRVACILLHERHTRIDIKFCNNNFRSRVAIVYSHFIYKRFSTIPTDIIIYLYWNLKSGGVLKMG